MPNHVRVYIIWTILHELSSKTILSDTMAMWLQTCKFMLFWRMWYQQHIYYHTVHLFGIGQELYLHGRTTWWILAVPITAMIALYITIFNLSLQFWMAPNPTHSGCVPVSVPIALLWRVAYLKLSCILYNLNTVLLGKNVLHISDPLQQPAALLWVLLETLEKAYKNLPKMKEVDTLIYSVLSVNF